MHCHASPIDCFRGLLTLTFSCPQGAPYLPALDVTNNFDTELVNKNVVLIAYNISQEGGMRDGETRRPEGPGRSTRVSMMRCLRVFWLEGLRASAGYAACVR
jgi:hypothetical protein